MPQTQENDAVAEKVSYVSIIHDTLCKPITAESGEKCANRCILRNVIAIVDR